MYDKTNLFSDNCKKCGTIPTYADDATYIVTTSSRFEAQMKITENVDKIKKFLVANQLTINLGKTEILETMTRQKRVRLEGTPPQLTVLKPDNTLKSNKIIQLHQTTRNQHQQRSQMESTARNW